MRVAGGKASAAAVGGGKTTAAKASPMTASAARAAILAGTSTATVGTRGAPTGAEEVLAGSRAVTIRMSGGLPVGGTGLKEEDTAMREQEVRVAEKMETPQVGTFDRGVVQQELLIEG